MLIDTDWMRVLISICRDASESLSSSNYRPGEMMMMRMMGSFKALDVGSQVREAGGSLVKNQEILQAGSYGRSAFQHHFEAKCFLF